MLLCGVFALFVTYFVHNVSATVSYGKKRASGYQDSDHSPRIRLRFFSSTSRMHRTFSEHPTRTTSVICMRKRRRYRGLRAGCLVRIRRRRVGKLPLPALIANVQSLDNELDEVQSRISYQWDIKNCNILCFTELWLNDDMDIQLAGVATSVGGRRGGPKCSVVRIHNTLNQK